MNKPGITTEATGWISTDRHASPIDSSVFTVYVKLHLNGIQIGTGFHSRPFREMPYITTDAELRETEFWSEMVAEARAKAMHEAETLLGALKETAA